MERQGLRWQVGRIKLFSLLPPDTSWRNWQHLGGHADVALVVVGDHILHESLHDTWGGSSGRSVRVGIHCTCIHRYCFTVDWSCRQSCRGLDGAAGADPALQVVAGRRHVAVLGS